MKHEGKTYFSLPHQGHCAKAKTFPSVFPAAGTATNWLACLVWHGFRGRMLIFTQLLHSSVIVGLHRGGHLRSAPWWLLFFFFKLWAGRESLCGRHTTVTPNWLCTKQTNESITATKQLCGYKPAQAELKKLKKKQKLFLTEFCITGAVFLFHTLVFALSQHLCSCIQERNPKSQKNFFLCDRTIRISVTGAHVPCWWKSQWKGFGELAQPLTIHLSALDSALHLSDAKVWLHSFVSALN